MQSKTTLYMNTYIYVGTFKRDKLVDLSFGIHQNEFEHEPLLRDACKRFKEVCYHIKYLCIKQTTQFSLSK